MNRRNLLSSIFTGAGLGAVASTSAQSASEAMERDPLLANIGELRFAEDPDPSNPLSINSREHLNHYVQHGTFIPNLELLNQEGQTVHFYEDCVKGKIVLINFMYTKCRGKCPRATRNLTEVQKLLGERLGKDFHFLSISIDPEEDKPEVLKAYMELYEIKSGWTFLTGKKETIEELRRAMGFIDPDPVLDADRSNHAGVVLYGNEAAHRWAACPGQSKPDDIVYFLNRVQTGSVRYPSGPTRLEDTVDASS